MKPEKIALLLLLVMLTASVGNLILLKKSVAILTDLTESIEEDAHAGDWDRMRENAREAGSLWEKRLRLFQLTLRHSETAEVTQLFADLEASIEGKNSDEASRSAAQIRGILTELLRLEEPRLSTVF